MPILDAELNNMLDNTNIALMSLHTADPSTNGANEVSGGSYARQSVTFSAASGGSKAVSNTPAFDVPGGSTVTHVGFWDSGGTTFLASYDVTDETFGNDGTYTVTSGSISLS